MKIVIVGSTHGNERTGLFLVNQWMQDSAGLPAQHDYKFLIANPKAAQKNVRFVDFDLNRSFGPNYGKATGYEKTRSIEIKKELAQWAGDEPYFLIDLHTTTSNMGVTFVLSKSDALSAWAVVESQKKTAQSYILFNDLIDGECRFVDSLAPHGCIVEVGPVAQGFEDRSIIEKTERAVIHLLNQLTETPPTENLQLQGFEEVGGQSYPKDSVIHPNFLFTDYQELSSGREIFQNQKGEAIRYQGETCFPVFIGEAAYLPSNHAFTKAVKISKTFSFRKQ